MNIPKKRPVRLFCHKNILYYEPIFVQESIAEIMRYKVTKNIETYQTHLIAIVQTAHAAYTNALTQSSSPEKSNAVITVSCTARSFLATLYNALGKIYIQQYNIVEAETSFNTALSLDAHNTKILYNMAELSCARRRFEESRSLCMRILHKEATHIGATYLIATAYASEGNPNDALDYFLKTTRLDSAFFGAHYWTGECFLYQGAYAQALPYFKRAYELSQQRHEDSARGYAICALACNQPSLALDICTKLLQEAPANHIVAMQIMGDAHIALHNIAEGATWHSRLVRIERDCRDFVIHKLHNLAKDQGREKARIYAAILLDAMPDLYESFAFLYTQNSLLPMATQIAV